MYDPNLLQAHNTRELLRDPDAYGSWMGVNSVIDPRDEIYRFFASHPLAANSIREYLSDGWRTMVELMVVLESSDRSLFRFRSILEFASGYGRFTRHLAKALPGRVTCSDVQAGSVDFCREQFGVQGFYSTGNVQQLTIPGKFDLVFVLSLFTHLPTEAWSPWIQRLHAAVAPGGALVVSFHNETRARDLGVKFNEHGVHFTPSSESSSLEPTSYGTTFTTRQFTEAEIARAVPDRSVSYHEVAFWGGQDAVVIDGPR